MEKTKLGISIGLMGAIMWLVCYFGGIVPSLLLAGYILMAENNEWLKKLSVKAVVLMFVFSLLPSILYLLPNMISCIDGLVGIFGGSFYLSFVSNLVSFIITILDLIEKLVFILFAALSFMQITFPVPVIDAFVDKHFEAKAE